MKKVLLGILIVAAIVLAYTVGKNSYISGMGKADKFEKSASVIDPELQEAVSKPEHIKSHQNRSSDCRSCHVCDVPTKDNPCLVGCPRTGLSSELIENEGPDVVSIAYLKDKYSAVNFSHKTHAQMSEMSGGCANCHHFNTVGSILACKECHSVERKREDISKPDLQSAYHRQCINCHKEWSGSTDCNACHDKKGTALVKTGAVKDHPKVSLPDKLVYQTKYAKGRIVTFYHNDHTNLYGSGCKSCHENNSCTRCHDKRNNDVKLTSISQLITKSKTDHHQPCFNCHANDNCNKCHMDKQMAPFNHAASTGFDLSKHHSKLSCNNCHSDKKFKKMDGNCTSCHKNFKQGSFKHEATGLKLDEIHQEFDCGDCHANNKFSAKVECSACHEKSYPKDKPGKTVKK